MKRKFSPIPLGLFATLLFGGVLFAQRADRATITGLVLDTSGGAVPAAAVTIIDESTGMKAVVSSTSTGNYTTPPLVLGTYTVQVEKQGFKTYVRSGILLTAGANYRQDATLEVGAVTQTIEVKAASEMINVQTSEISHLVNERYYAELPAVFVGDVRMPENLLLMQPGFTPGPTGQSTNAPQFASRINGGQRAGTENFLDGASYGEVYTHNYTGEKSAPMESIREMKVIDSNFSAQYGRTSGGVIEYTSKSGTRDFHGSVYEYMVNSALNARGEIAKNVDPRRQNEFGFALGGPVVIPKVYNGREKTFFFVNLDMFRGRPGVSENYNYTLATTEARTGDFSRVLTLTTQVGTDVLGRPIYKGEIFNPATTRLVGGIPVRDGYGFDPVTGLPIAGSANIIPAADPLRSQVAAKYIPLMVPLNRDTVVNNTARPPWGMSANFDTLLARVDHTFSNNLKTAGTFLYTQRPRDACDAEAGGCTRVGGGFAQNIRTSLIHQQFDWIIRPNLFNHTTVGYDRWFIVNHLTGQDGVIKDIGLKGTLRTDGGSPDMSWSSSIVPYSGFGVPWRPDGAYATNRWQFLDDLTWIQGRHTVKAGFEYRHHSVPVIGWQENRSGNWAFDRLSTGGYDAVGNTLSQTGDGFASFILGQVYAANFQIVAYPTFREAYISPWVNDEIKVTRNLTLNIGFRFDYQTAETEKNDRLGSFSPTTPNPGAGGLLGATVFAGTGAGRTGKRTFQDPPIDAWGPRFGIAYRLGEKTSLRAGYGIYYAGTNMSNWLYRPTAGSDSFPAVNNTTNGLYPTFLLDDGFPQSAVTIPPTYKPDLENGGSPIYMNPDSQTLPRFQNWVLSVQRQLSANTMVEVSYVANHGTRLISNGSATGMAANMSNPAVLKLGSALLQKRDFTDPAVVAAGITKPYPTFTGNVAQALRPYPQYQRVTWWNAPAGMSLYHSLQVKAEKRFAGGLQFRVAYTWSKLIDDAESAISSNNPTAVQDPLNVVANRRSLSTDDVPHMLMLAWVYELPFGTGKRFLNVGGAANKLLGGWKVSGMQRYDSGRPLGITMSNDMSGLIFNDQKRPNKLGGGLGTTAIGDYDPNDPAKNRYLVFSGWADPGPLKFGSASRTDPVIRGFHTYTENVRLTKATGIYQERVRLEFEAEFRNLFNRHTWCPPSTNWSTTSTFGVTVSQCQPPRQPQLALRLVW